MIVNYAKILTNYEKENMIDSELIREQKIMINSINTQYYGFRQVSTTGREDEINNIVKMLSLQQEMINNYETIIKKYNG